MDKFNLDIPKMGHVLAVKYERKKKFNIFSEGIYQKQLWEGFNNEDALYTHVAISSGGQHIVNVVPPRAKFVDLTKVYKGAYVKFLKYNEKDFDNYKRYKIMGLYNALASNLGYDFRGLAAFIIPYIKQMPTKFFCSEACCKAYQMIYPEFLNGIKPENCMPCHFFDESLEKVWEGYIPK